MSPDKRAICSPQKTPAHDPVESGCPKSGATAVASNGAGQLHVAPATENRIQMNGIFFIEKADDFEMRRRAQIELVKRGEKNREGFVNLVVNPEAKPEARAMSRC